MLFLDCLYKRQQKPLDCALNAPKLLNRFEKYITVSKPARLSTNNIGYTYFGVDETAGVSR